MDTLAYDGTALGYDDIDKATQRKLEAARVRRVQFVEAKRARPGRPKITKCSKCGKEIFAATHPGDMSREKLEWAEPDDSDELFGWTVRWDIVPDSQGKMSWELFMIHEFRKPPEDATDEELQAAYGDLDVPRYKVHRHGSRKSVCKNRYTERDDERELELAWVKPVAAGKQLFWRTRPRRKDAVLEPLRVTPGTENVRLRLDLPKRPRARKQELPFGEALTRDPEPEDRCRRPS